MASVISEIDPFTMLLMKTHKSKSLRHTMHQYIRCLTAERDAHNSKEETEHRHACPFLYGKSGNG